MSPDSTHQRPDRNLALELVRVTEAAALAAARLVGRGDKEAADQAAVDGMRYALHSVQMDGVVVIGEGEKDEAPMLYNGERIGDGSPPEVDIAVDPLEGTDARRARDAERARRDRALRPRRDVRSRSRASTWKRWPAPPRSPTCSISTGRCPRRSQLIADRKGCEIGDVMVVVLDRPRHGQGIKEIREAGARVRLIRAWRRLRVAPRRHRALARRPAVGHRRHARGRHLGRRDQVPRRPVARAPVAARRA